MFMMYVTEIITATLVLYYSNLISSVVQKKRARRKKVLTSRRILADPVATLAVATVAILVADLVATGGGAVAVVGSFEVAATVALSLFDLVMLYQGTYKDVLAAMNPLCMVLQE